MYLEYLWSEWVLGAQRVQNANWSAVFLQSNSGSVRIHMHTACGYMGGIVMDA